MVIDEVVITVPCWISTVGEVKPTTMHVGVWDTPDHHDSGRAPDVGRFYPRRLASLLRQR